MIEVPYWALFSCTHLLAACFGAVLISTIATYVNKKGESNGTNENVHSSHRDS